MFEKESFYTWEIVDDGKVVHQTRYLKLIIDPVEVWAVIVRDGCKGLAPEIQNRIRLDDPKIVIRRKED